MRRIWKWMVWARRRIWCILKVVLLIEEVRGKCEEGYREISVRVLGYL
jgi:hypothetical protein